MSSNFEMAAFSDLLQDKFTLYLDPSTSVELELIRVQSLSSSSQSPSNARAPFSIEFRSPGSEVLEQKIYSFHHPRLGAFEIFIVPVGSDGENVYYEAIFS